MDSSLDSVLSGEPTEEAEVVTEQPAETQEAQTPEVKDEGTGEETGAPPEPRKEEPLDKAAEGLKAAATAERKRRQEAEQRAAALQQELEALRRPQVQQQPQQQQDDGKPLRSQFESEDEWLDARDAWRDQQRELKEQREAAEREATTLAQKTEGIYAQAQKLEGFDRAAFDALPLTRPMAEALIESDNGPALMHFMSSNPEEVGRIALLPKTRQIAELIRIEDKLNAQPKEEPEKVPPKEKPALPSTLTQARDTRGRFEKPETYDGPTPLNAILASK